MTIEEKLKEKSFCFLCGTKRVGLDDCDCQCDANKSTHVIHYKDVLTIAKEYAEEQKKLLLALVICECRDKFYFYEGDYHSSAKIDYLKLRNIIETTKLATEEE